MPEEKIEDGLKKEVTPPAPEGEEKVSILGKEMTLDEAKKQYGDDIQDKLKTEEEAKLRHDDYTKKTQELAEQRAELQELADFGERLKADPEKAKKVLAILEEKKEEVKEELEGLDLTDPYAKGLKKILDSVTRLEKKVVSLEERDVVASEEARTVQAQQLLRKTLDDHAKDLKFSDEEEKGLWITMVLSHLKDNPQQYRTEEEFISSIKSIGIKYRDMLKKVGEKRVKAYLEEKGKPVPPAPGAVGGVLPEKPTMENLQEGLEKMLEEEGKA